MGQLSFASSAHSLNFSFEISGTLADKDSSMDSTTPSTKVSTDSVSRDSGEKPFSLRTKLNFILKQPA